VTLGAAYAECERIARRSAANFYPAFLVLPRQQRRGMYALYAFNRLTDDISDGPGTPEERRRDLDRWEQQLAAALDGAGAGPVLSALRDTVQRFGIPPQHLIDVIDGCRMDLEPRRFESFPELHHYCRLVAAAVGLACIHVWGFRGADAPRYAEAAGVALQLTNILRDLGEDRARGRVYLPAEDLRRFGCCPNLICSDPCEPAFQELMRFEVARARAYYDEAKGLDPLIAPAGRAVFRVLVGTYRALLDRIEAAGFDVFTRRVCVGTRTKVGLVLRALPLRWGWSVA
jgi:phytoene synthase